ncbi:MAG: glycosyltransferase family 4 protein [Marinifilaceae bacterium]
MKVLLVSPLPPPSGGIASWTKHVLAYFKANINDIELIHYNTGGGIRRITDFSLIKRVFFGLKDLNQRVNDIINIALKEKVDVVHLTSSASLGIFRDYKMLNRLKKYNYKTCIHFRFGRIPDLAAKKNWEWLCLRKVCALASSVIVIDLNSYNTLIDYGYKNVYYLPNPISETIESKLKKSIIENREDGSVLFVGHITRFKGVFELVSACSQIKEVTTLTLIGPYEKSVYKKLVSIAGLKNGKHWLEFTGNKDQQYILERMQRCSVFVLPSYTEGFPNVILESMASAAPILATDVGAIPDMLNVDSEYPVGICVKPMQTIGLKDCLMDLLRNPQKSIHMGRCAQRRVFDKYSMKSVIKNLIDIWSK